MNPYGTITMHVGSAKSLDCFMCLIYSSFIDIVLLPNRYCMKFNSADTKNINTYVYIYIIYSGEKRFSGTPYMSCAKKKALPSLAAVYQEYKNFVYLAVRTINKQKNTVSLMQAKLLQVNIS